MDDVTTELTERFERYCDTKDHEFPSDVLAELQSMLRLYSISPEELDFKWQAYNMKMGGEESKMDVKTARDFKKTIQDALERESRGKAQQRNDVKRGQPTPRAKGGDMYDMYVGICKHYIVPKTNWRQAGRTRTEHTTAQYIERRQWQHSQEEGKLQHSRGQGEQST